MQPKLKYPPTWAGIRPLLWAAMVEKIKIFDHLSTIEAIGWAKHVANFAAILPSDDFTTQWKEVEVPQEQRDALLKSLSPELNPEDWFAQRLAKSFGVTLPPIGDYWEGHNLLEERAYLRTLEE